MGDGEEEIFSEGVEEAECNVILVEAAEDGFLFEVVEHVVHPAHVPLHGEAETAEIDGVGYSAEGG